MTRQVSSQKLTFCNNSTNELSNNEILKKERDAALQKATEYKEQLDAVFRAFELTFRIASMDSTAYYYSQVGKNTIPVDCTKGRIQRRDSITTDGRYESGAKLDAMLLEWKFEQTPLANLVSSVHRLQSNLFHAQNEANTAIEQEKIMHDDVVRYKERKQKLEKAVKLLSKDNRVLRDALEKCAVELQETKVECGKLVMDRDEKELNKAESRMSAQVEEHEKIMRDKTRIEVKLPSKDNMVLIDSPENTVVELKEIKEECDKLVMDRDEKELDELVCGWGGGDDLICSWGTSDRNLSIEYSSTEGGATQPGVDVVKENSDNTLQSLETVGGTVMLQLHPRLPTLNIPKKKKKKREKVCPMLDLQLEDKYANDVGLVAKDKTFIKILGFTKDMNKISVQE